MTLARYNNGFYKLIYLSSAAEGVGTASFFRPWFGSFDLVFAGWDVVSRVVVVAGCAPAFLCVAGSFSFFVLFKTPHPIEAPNVKIPITRNIKLVTFPNLITLSHLVFLSVKFRFKFFERYCGFCLDYSTFFKSFFIIFYGCSFFR